MSLLSADNPEGSNALRLALEAAALKKASSAPAALTPARRTPLQQAVEER